MKILLVGDVHCVPSEIEECNSLMEKILSIKGYDAICFMGDQYNNHDAMSVRVMNFWHNWFSKLKNCFVIVGNHDQSGAGLEEVHSMRAHSDQVVVVDKPTEICSGTWAVPYYDTEEKFRAATRELKGMLLCHATFDGAAYDNGFYAPDGFSLDSVAQFDGVISGHIHTPQSFSNVTYIGAPRWRTLSDANIDRHLWLYDFEKQEVVEKIPTDDACRRIWKFSDLPNEPVDLSGVSEKDDVRVDIFGKPEHVEEREKILRAQGVRTRRFPDKKSRVSVKESDGIPEAFSGFVEAFSPPNGTSKEILKKEIGKRVYETP